MWNVEAAPLRRVLYLAYQSRNVASLNVPVCAATPTSFWCSFFFFFACVITSSRVRGTALGIDVLRPITESRGADGATRHFIAV